MPDDRKTTAQTIQLNDRGSVMHYQKCDVKLTCDTYECLDRLWCIQRGICKREQEMEDQHEL